MRISHGGVDHLRLHGERNDWQAPGWACFFEYPFKIGYVYPFTPVLKCVLQTLGVRLLLDAVRLAGSTNHISRQIKIEGLILGGGLGVYF